MIVFLNGRFAPEAGAVVSVFDRGFLYGDGLFETLAVFNGQPFRWQQHLERLQRGAEFLKIRLPFTAEALRDFARQLIEKNRMPDALLRLTVSRGMGVRGYSPKSAQEPTVVMSLHAAPAGDGKEPKRWRLMTSSVRLPVNDPLAQFKTCNKLPQILARAEADTAGADEALLISSDGHVAEGSSSNFFWIESGSVCTTPLASGVLPGVTRAVVLELCQKLGVDARQATVAPDQLRWTQGVFLSLSSAGIVEALSPDGQALGQSPLVAELYTAYRAVVLADTK